MVSITKKSLQVAMEVMAIADETEDPIPSFSSQSMEIKHGNPDMLSLQDMHKVPDVLSPEDIDWADSCLIKDPEISQIDWGSWNSFREALGETESFETDSAMERIENRPEGADMEIPSRQPTGDSEIMGTESSITDKADTNSVEKLINEHTDVLLSEMSLEDILLPTWNENLEKLRAFDTEEYVDFPDFVMEQSTVDIFKVWDLGLPDEEEFVNQLNEALAQSTLEPSPSVSGDYEQLKGMKDITIDDIISGISDLSMQDHP